MGILVEPFYKAFGKKLLEWRKKRGLNQEDVGRLLATPVKKQTIAKIEAGLQRIPLHTLVEIAWALGVDEHDLLPQGGSGRPSEDEWENRIQRQLAHGDKEAPPKVDEGGGLTEAERRRRRKELEAELAKKLGSRSQAKTLATKFTKKR